MSCQKQYTNLDKKNQAKEQDLERIKFVTRDQSFPNISNKASAILSCFISLYRLNYTGVSSYIEVINRSIDRCGYHMSERTFYRGLSELEGLGFFSRKKYRVKHDKFMTIIEFNLERFRFWKRSSSMHTQTHIAHISSSLPNCQESLRTSSNIRVNSCDITAKEQNKPRARASRFKNWVHPVLYSLMCVLKAQKALDRALIISRARWEIDAGRAGIDIPGHSGIDWDRPSWQEMPRTHREQVIRNEILPVLRKKPENQSNSVSELISAIIGQEGAVQYREPEIRYQIVHAARELPNVQIDLPKADLDILVAARNRAMQMQRRS